MLCNVNSSGDTKLCFSNPLVSQSAFQVTLLFQCLAVDAVKDRILHIRLKQKPGQLHQHNVLKWAWANIVINWKILKAYIVSYVSCLWTWFLCPSSPVKTVESSSWRYQIQYHSMIHSQFRHVPTKWYLPFLSIFHALLLVVLDGTCLFHISLNNA